jgi:hypothetical protein
VYGGGVSGGNQ